MSILRVLTPQKLRKGVNVRIDFESKVTFNVRIASGQILTFSCLSEACVLC